MLTDDICRDMIHSQDDISIDDITKNDTKREEEEMEQLVKENTNEVRVEQKPKKKAWKGILFSFLALFAFLGIQVLVSGVASAIMMVQCVGEAGGDMTAGQELYMDKIQNSGFMTNILCIATAVSAIVAILWYKLAFVKKYTVEKKEELRKNVLHGRVIAMLVIAAVGCYALDVTIANLVAWLNPASMDTFELIMGSALSGSLVISFLTMVILAPIAEECLMRGIIFQMLSKRFAAVPAVILSAFFFSLYHLNIMQAIYVLPLGLLLGYTAYKCKSVLPCILIHMVNNLMPFLIMMLPEALQGGLTFITIFVVCAVALCLIWKMQSKEER